MRSQSLQVWRTKCLYLTQFGVSSRIFPTSTSPAAQHGPSGRARARGAINLQRHTDHLHTPFSALLTRASHFLYSIVQAKHAHGHRPWARARRPCRRPRRGRPHATRVRLPTAPKLARQLAARPPAACCTRADDVHLGRRQNVEVRAVDELAGCGIVGPARGLQAQQAVSGKQDV